jgi:hypothetical protein
MSPRQIQFAGSLYTALTYGAVVVVGSTVVVAAVVVVGWAVVVGVVVVCCATVPVGATDSTVDAGADEQPTANTVVAERRIRHLRIPRLYE